MKLKTLSQLRESYPEYNDWSDEELLGGIHQKYFSNMPLSDYYAQTGFSQAVESENIDQEVTNQLSTSGWSGAEDLGIDTDLTPYFATAPRESNLAASAITSNPTTHALTAGATGVENISLGLQQLISGMTGAKPQELAAEDAQNEATYLWAKSQSPWSAMAGRFGGEMAATAPALAIPGAREAQVAKTAGTSAAKLIPYLQNYFSKAGIQGAATGGASYVAEDESRAMNAGMSALFSSLLAIPFLPSQLKADFPAHKMIPMSNLPAEELLKRQEAAAGTETPLYNITDNLDLKSFEENIIAPLPYSGVAQSNQRISEQLKEKSSGIVKKVSNKDELKKENVEIDIEKKILNKNEETKALSDALYERTRDTADLFGIKTENVNTGKKAESFKGELETYPLRRLQEGDPFYNELDAYSQYAKPGTNNPIPFDIAEKQRSGLLKQSRQAGRADEPHKKHVYDELAEAQKLDIEESATLSGVPQLAEEAGAARKYYRENRAPYKEIPFLKEHTSGLYEKNTNKIPNELKNNFNLETLKTYIPEAIPDAAYLKFQDSITGEGDINLPKFVSTYKKMDPKQKELLGINSEEVDSFVKLYEMNPEAINPGFNPKTGVRALPLKAMMGTIAGGYTVAGLPGAVGAIPIAMSLSKYATNKLRNEGFRDQVVSGMVAEKLKQQLGNFEPGSMEFDQLAARIGQYEQKAMNPAINEISRLLQASFRNTAASQ